MYLLEMPERSFEQRKREKGLIMATKQELIAQIKDHEETLPRLEAMQKDIPIQIEQLKATIKLKRQALTEIKVKEIGDCPF